MPIEYIVEGVSGVDAAEKIKVAFEEKRNAVNPWVENRLAPAESEGFKSGAGKYRFENVLGYPEVERRGAAPTTNTETYQTGMTVLEVVLNVEQPFMTGLFTFQDSDKIQLDGIDFSAKSNKKVMNTLLKAEIKTETAVVLNNANVRTATILETEALEQAIAIKNEVASYYDISEANGWLPTATRYFDAGTGDFTNEELIVHMHPARISFLSNLNTQAGAGSEAQFMEFKNGTLTHINGAVVKANKYVGADKIAIVPVGMIGTPDDAVMLTKVKVFTIENTDTTHVKGWHWFDAILVAPELVTIITLPVIARATTKVAKKAETKPIETNAQKKAREKAEAEAEALAKESKESKE